MRERERERERDRQTDRQTDRQRQRQRQRQRERQRETERETERDRERERKRERELSSFLEELQNDPLWTGLFLIFFIYFLHQPKLLYLHHLKRYLFIYLYFLQREIKKCISYWQSCLSMSLGQSYFVHELIVKSSFSSIPSQCVQQLIFFSGHGGLPLFSSPTKLC